MRGGAGVGGAAAAARGAASRGVRDLKLHLK